jgi:2-dehydro-3-deoxyphosphooctonate aldolase (KDO 8-P synthase)
VCDELGVDYYFKASWDKANRTSIGSYRGPGLNNGLNILRVVKADTGVKVLTDFHVPSQVKAVAEVADVLQIPAFLCRQTDMIVAAAGTGRTVNVKKGQFMAPEDMKYVVDKFRSSGGENIWLTERGTFFGYGNLVVDYRNLLLMDGIGDCVVFDATHSVQRPGLGSGCSGGERKFVPSLAAAAVSVGVDGLFFEVHPDPDSAKCDGANSLKLDDFGAILGEVLTH